MVRTNGWEIKQELLINNFNMIIIVDPNTDYIETIIFKSYLSMMVVQTLKDNI